MKEKGGYKHENQYFNECFLEKCTLNNLEMSSIMFQVGYLTIKDKDTKTNELRLDYPNQEVRDAYLLL
jgi:hypothetical protein